MGASSPVPKRKNKSAEIKCSYSFSAFKAFPEPCCALAGRMRVDVEPVCFVTLLRVQPGRSDKVATGEKAKAKAACQTELFKGSVLVAEKLHILLGACLSGKNQNQSILHKKPQRTTKH